jgi:hypothetical protein
MIRNKATETYSERAVLKFKTRVRRCANLTIAILAITILYFLFVPSAKFTKKDR